MTREEGRAIADAINGALGTVLKKLSDAPQAVERRPGGTVLHGRPLDENGKIDLKITPAAGQVVVSTDEEALYQRFKRRMIDECRVDPVLLTLLAKAAPELEIEIEPRRVSIDTDSLKGRIARLIGSGFFTAPRSSADVRRELIRTGTEPAGNRLSEAFTALVNEGFLTREGEGYQIAPGVKVTERVLQVA